ncbi:Kae1-associated serine/threonine protein kinase [Candidatus Woesearchaeota archaeon]|nr:Kae1-associated serine/threonine protein kinase [Candidatus Woesearchaeota archaeon]
MLKLAHGAEAVLYEDRGEIIKERLSKAYRLPQLDDSLRKFRTRREAKVLQKLEEMNFPAPHLRDFCDKRMSIVMDFMAGEKLKDVLAQGDDYQRFGWEIGQRLGQMHGKHIIHGDLTTSNMILAQGQVNFIDFGLSFFSEKEEDKAVDLFLLDRALESTHADLHQAMFEKVLEGYKEVYPDAEKILERLEKVRRRGRNKNK